MEVASKAMQRENQRSVPLPWMYYPPKKGSKVYTSHNLPAPGSFTRWIPSRIELFVLAIMNKLISREDFLERYGVKGGELDFWFSQIQRHGREGIKLEQRIRKYVGAPQDVAKKQGIVSLGPCVVDLETGKITKGSAEIFLPNKPRELLSLFVEKMGEVITREDIYHHLYQYAEKRPQQKIIDVMVFKLRQQLGGKDVIETIWGRGYKLRAAAPL